MELVRKNSCFFSCTDKLFVKKATFSDKYFVISTSLSCFFSSGKIYSALMISSIDNFSDKQFVWVGIGIKARPGSACTTEERLLPVYLVRWYVTKLVFSLSRNMNFPYLLDLQGITINPCTLLFQSITDEFQDEDRSLPYVFPSVYFNDYSSV